MSANECENCKHYRDTIIELKEEIIERLKEIKGLVEKGKKEEIELAYII